jgi:serine protease
MKKQLLVALFVGISCCMSAQGAFTSGEVLVQLQPGADPKAVEALLDGEVGLLPAFTLKKEVSKPMRVWLYTFHGDAAATKDMVRLLKTMPGVSEAQVNHIIAERIVPNDPFLGQQWHHINNNDKDIDSDLAWDITTGGLTALGDEIVVCVIEPSGTGYTQADIAPNHWVNEAEIPDNNIDDDGNGYVDDYNGWDIINESDQISTGNHGTSVSSMIGSKGDNNTGVVGVNWDVKIMQVDMNGISESNVIEAYTYPMIMRKRYNETNGASGAFVVATNSSWGTDGGQPEDAPLWCAMYDSLGHYGILSAGATANNNVNIDVVSDLPTGCPSDFMLSVTATNDNDVRTFSGYGATTIDLGAPGEDVYLASNNGYSATSGTSFASPCVAGAVALLYSAPCSSIALIAHSDPALAAAMLKTYIMDGTDAAPALSGECITGGRLNVYNSLQLLLAECSNDGCLAPFSIGVAQTPGTLDYTMSWSTLPGIASVSVRYRVTGSSTWTQLDNLSGTSLALPGLMGCSMYEVQMKSFCESGESEWTNSVTWETDGCCENPAWIEVTGITETSITLSWDDVLAAESYTITYSTGGVAEVIDGALSTTATLNGLVACTPYVISVSSVCVSTLPPVVTVNTTTLGCGACLDLEYCTVTGATEYEWIESVEFGDISNTSGNDQGYGNFIDQSTAVIAGQSYPIVLTPGYEGMAYSEYFKVWIDYDNDGSFAEMEVAFDAGQGTTTGVSGNVTIPENAIAGACRMRVAMGYVSWFTGNDPPPACGDVGEGEAEDYCVTILPSLGVEDEQMATFVSYPNPATDVWNIQWPGATVTEVRLYTSIGQQAWAGKPQDGRIDVSGLAPGLYVATVLTKEGALLRTQVLLAR